MKPKVALTTLCLAALLICREQLVSQTVQQSTPSITTTSQDQQSLAVTIYNSNLGLVKDVRKIALQSGLSELKFMDVAAQINPATVHIKSLTSPGQFSVQEQNYEYDLLNPQKLLDKYVGKEVTLVRLLSENNTTVERPVKALLLSNNNGQPVWQLNNEIVTGMHADRYIFPQLPENLIAQPTLVWRLENGGSRSQTLEASYLTGGITWKADYVLNLGVDEKTADLNGWVTIDNRSGAGYKNASLQLVAGEINRVREMTEAAMEMRAKPARAEMAKQQFGEESFFEYHLYTLDRKTTLKDNQTKQISLLSGTGAAVRKEYVVNGQNFYYHNRQNPGTPLKDQVETFIELKNSKENNLGLPLPKGVLRVYKADTRGGQQLIGEDKIDHTPKDETVRVKLGNAFDIVAERNQTDFQVISDRVYEMGFNVTLRNHKDQAITVVVNEPIGGDWRMLQSTFEHEKTAAFAARFKVPVAANGQAKLTYRVRVRY
ncbi:MAG: DUF4139 domain-containing protein [Acidobacteria bacterium]|nr:DUF4139 domain-containing protein [Acidobacteriota bacterium]